MLRRPTIEAFRRLQRRGVCNEDSRLRDGSQRRHAWVGDGQADMFNKWRPLFNRGKIDLMISGHLHRYAVIQPKKGIHGYAMIIGGGPKDRQATIIRVDATKKKLEVTMTRDDGEVVGRYELD